MFNRCLLFALQLFFVAAALAQPVPGPSDPNAFADLSKRRTDLNIEVPVLEKRIADLNLSIDDARFLPSDIQRLKSDSAYYEEQIVRLGKVPNSDSAIESYKYSISYNNNRIKDMLDQLESTKKITKERDSVNTVLGTKRNELFQIENQISQLMIPKLSQQNFMFWTSLFFVLLMSFLLGTFFFVLSRDTVIRQKIFGSDSGIQFITLFSIVIAIISFGLTGILEGKELAALLGSIAGYILGRVNLAPPDKTP